MSHDEVTQDMDVPLHTIAGNSAAAQHKCNSTTSVADTQGLQQLEAQQNDRSKAQQTYYTLVLDLPIKAQETYHTLWHEATAP